MKKLIYIGLCIFLIAFVANVSGELKANFTFNDIVSDSVSPVLDLYGDVNGSVGLLRGAMGFDDSSSDTEYLEIGNTKDFNETCHTGGCSFCSWTKLDGTGTYTLLGKWDVTANPAILFGNGNTGEFRLFLGEGNTNEFFGSTITTGVSDLDKWYHVCGVYNGSSTYSGNVSMYINGTSVPVTPTGSTGGQIRSSEVGAWSEKVFIGAYRDSDPVSQHKGLIDDFVIYDRNLSASEISSLYQGGTPTQEARDIVTDTIVFYSSMDQLMDTTGNILSTTPHANFSITNVTPISDTTDYYMSMTSGDEKSFQLGNTSLVANEWTISLWANFSDFATSSASSGRVFAMFGQASGVSENRIDLATNSANTSLRTLIYDSTGTNFKDYDFNISDDTGSVEAVWKFLTVTWDGTDLKGYMDGAELTGSPRQDDAITMTNTLRRTSIGNRPDVFNTPHIGAIDEVLVYNNSLSSAEILTLYSRYLDNYTLSFYNQNPQNDTGLSGSTVFNYALSGFGGEINCSIYVNDTLKLTQTGLSNGANSFTYLTSYGNDGYNRVFMNCTDGVIVVNDTEKWIWQDTIIPVFAEVNYTNLDGEFEFNLSTINQTFNFSINVTDDNMYLFNLSLYRANTNTADYTDYYNFTPQIDYVYTNETDLTGFVSGWYLLNMTVADAHTSIKVDFDKWLKDEEYIIPGYYGIQVDDTFQIYVDDADINKMEIKTETIYSKTFKFKFNTARSSFDVFIEADSIRSFETEYMGHLVINDLYWVDFVPEKNDVYVSEVVNLGDKFKVTISTTGASYKNFKFNSFGIINYAYYEEAVFVDRFDRDHDIVIETFTNPDINVNNFGSLTYANRTEFVFISKSINLSAFHFSFRHRYEYLQKLNVSVAGTLVANPDNYTSGNDFTGYYSTGNLSAIVQSALPACDCAGCNTSITNYCGIPLLFERSGGICVIDCPSDTYSLNLSHLFVSYDYDFGLNNCSTGSGSPTLNLTLLNESTEQLIEGTIEINFNYSGFNISQEFNETFSPVNYTEICIEPDTIELLSDFHIEYYIDEDRFTYFGDDITLSNVTRTIPLYIVDDTTLVLFNVKDQQDNNIQNAYIVIDKYIVGSNSYKTIEILRTDLLGNALSNILVNTAWYRITIKYNGITYLVDGPTKIISQTLNYRIDLESSDYFNDFNNFRGIISSLTFTNSTSNFNLQYTDENLTANEICLNVKQVSLAGNTHIDTSCQNTASGTILVNIGTNTTDNNYLATAYASLADGTQYTLEVLEVSFETAWEVFDDDGKGHGIFITVMLLLALLFIGIWSPESAIVLSILAIVISSILGFFQISFPLIIVLVVMGGVAIWRIKDA